MRSAVVSVGVAAAAVAISAIVFAQSGDGTSTAPYSVTIQALRAVEADTASRAVLRWTNLLERRQDERAAELGIATIGWLRSDTTTAELHFKWLTANRRPDAYTVYAHLGRARSLDARAKFAFADAEYEAALREARQLHDSAAAGIILTNLSHVRYQTGGSLAGLAALDTASRLISRSDTVTLALYHGRRGGYLMQARNGGAELEVRACIDLAKRARIERTQGLCLSLLGIEMYQRGNVDSAVTLMRVAIAAYSRAHDSGARGDALVSLGRMLIVLGEYGDARAAVYQSLSDLRVAGQSPGWALFTLAEVSRTIHDRAAAQLARRSVQRFDEDGEIPGAIAARDVQARLALDAGDLRTARQLLAQNLTQARALKLPINEFDAHEVLSNVASSMHEWSTAQSELDSVRSLATRSHMSGWEGTLDYDYGMLAFHRGDFATAERDFKSYLRPLRESEGILRYRGHARLAGVYAARGEHERALKELESGGRALDQWRASLAAQDLRVLAFQSTDDLDPDLGVPTVLAQLATHGYADRALQMAERRRARSLADLLTRAEALRTKRVSGVQGARLIPRSQSAATTMPDRSTALLEYVTGSDGAPTTLLVATGSGPVHAYLLAPADTLETSIARLIALMSSGLQSARLERSLGSGLLDSAMSDLPAGITRLVIVPDGPLHAVPFDALRLSDGRFAVERYAISITPSAAVLASLETRSSRAAATAGRILVFGDVTFAPSVRRAGGARLPGSETEADHVARYSRDPEIRLRQDASEEYLKHADLEPFSVIHFATHALIDDASMSGTVLELAPSGAETGLVAPGDLAALRLRAAVVVLSACSTAGGVTVTGEGVQGLTAALLQAGARSVVATHWQIGDRSTIEFVDAFYSALAHKLDVSQALRAAKLDAIKRGAPSSQWGAFTVIGDPSVVVQLDAAPNHARMVLGVAILLLVLLATIYLFVVIRSRRNGELTSPLVVRARTHQE